MHADEFVTITATEFQRNIDEYQDIALTKQVAITQNGRVRTVLMSAEEHRRLKRRDRQVIAAGDLTGPQVEAIRNAKVPSEHAHLNEELRDWKE